MKVLNHHPTTERDATANTEAIIREARHREHQRRLIVGTTVLAVAGLTAGLVAAFGGSPPRNNKATTGSGKGGSAVGAVRDVARVATVDLTQNDKFSGITVVDSRILLYGSTARSADTAANTCFSVSVDPSSLVLSDERSGSCLNPALQGQQVIPVFATDKHLPASGGGPTAVVRIAHVVSRSPGYALGPVVMTFPALSWGDSEPTWIYGGGDLWLYEWDNPGGFDLARISATTGDVLERLRVPRIWHAILAYNDEGLWIAPSGQTSGPPYSLYLVAPGARHATAVFHFSDHGFAKWIVGSGDALWVNAQSPFERELGKVWMLRGPQLTPVWHVRESPMIVQVFETLGDSGMVGNGSAGLWGAPPTRYNKQQVVRVDPVSGRVSTQATLKTNYLVVGPAQHLTVGPTNYLYLSPLTSWRGVTLAGSFFLLDPPAPVPGTSNELGGFSALYRITPVRLGN
jgi:hypothetical protein